MRSQKSKRIMVILASCAGIVFLGILWLAYLVSRDPGFDWENPNVIEASEAQRKLKLFNTSLANASVGYVRFTQLEINSYLMSLTNRATSAEEGAPAATLRRAGVGLNNTNITLYSWAQASFLKIPLKFVLQRDFHIVQEGTNFWDLPADSFRIGDLEVPRRFWHRLRPVAQALDQPLSERFAWSTNIPALLVTKDKLSQRPELRLYTYKPIPEADRR